jgi:choline-phosphate cytidylyltransferase
MSSPTTGAMMISSEGWLEWFVTTPEKAHFARWNEVVRENKSIVQYVGAHRFAQLARIIPEHISPNLLTLSGMILLVQAWYAVHNYGVFAPTACTWLAILNIWGFFVITHVSILHADNMRQHTAFSDLFKYACDSGATVFLALLITYCFDSTETTQWHAVQACQLVLFLKHLSAYKRQAGLRYRTASGPGEVLLASMAILAVRAVVGLEQIETVYHQCGERLANYWMIHNNPNNNNYFAEQIANLFKISGGEWIKASYYGLFVAAILQSASLGKQHNFTRFGLLVSLLMRLVPALLLSSTATTTTTSDTMVATPVVGVTTMDVICDGLFMAVLTSDLALAKMAGRQLHPTVVLMSLAAVLSYGVILTLVAVYFIGVFSDLSFYLNLPLLAVAKNVYCDGVYDLCHIGHKRAFQNALRYGNRLFVGVVGDEDAKQYKRPPIMSHDERCAEVEACKAVTKVIPNAPCFGLTQEFLDEHQIHIVAMGEEYIERWPNPDDDVYYGYVRKLGIARTLPRTNALSTTELIERIRNAKDVDKKSPT